MKTIRVQAEDFDPAAVLDSFARTDIGAVVAFTGTVRDDGGLTALTVEHYPGMTEREISLHVDEAQRRWPVLAVAVIHRVGRLQCGERIVLVAVGCAHREPAFRAAEFLMDYLKTRAPLWKQEERGSALAWIEARESDADSALRWRGQ